MVPTPRAPASSPAVGMAILSWPRQPLSRSWSVIVHSGCKFTCVLGPTASIRQACAPRGEPGPGPGPVSVSGPAGRRISPVDVGSVEVAAVSGCAITSACGGSGAWGAGCVGRTRNLGNGVKSSRTDWRALVVVARWCISRICLRLTRSGDWASVVQRTKRSVRARYNAVSPAAVAATATSTARCDL